MYIKTKRVELKTGKVGKYYYIAMSIRLGKTVRPEIIKYIGKNVPPEIRDWLKKKNKYLKKKREEQRKFMRVRQC